MIDDVIHRALNEPTITRKSYRKAITCMATDKMWNCMGVRNQMKREILSKIQKRFHDKLEWFEYRDSPIQITLAAKVNDE
jgi:hypothetical protein